MAYIGNEPGLTNFIFGLNRFNGTGACTQFTLTRTTDDANSIEVLVNSVQQDPINSYSVSGGVITFTTAPSVGTNNIVVIYRSSAIISYNNVTSAQILDGAVTSSKLATSISNNSTIAWNTANAAFLAANAVTSTDTTQNNSITVALNTANAAFLRANTPSHVANSAASYANSAFAAANAATATDTTQNTNITSAASYANSAFATANSASIYANAAFTSSNTKATIASPSFTGNVGIGTASPDANLTVNGAASFAAGTALLPSIARAGDLNTGIYFPAADTIGFVEGGTEIMRITSTGNVGIGNTNPTEKLHVTGNILASENITAYSDKRIKKDIKKIENALEKVKFITGVLYKRTDLNDDRVYTGVIAQEVEAVLPEVVFESNNLKTVAYGNMIGLVIEAIKEQQTQIDELKNQLSGLTTIINTLRLGTKN
jgi:hypothetical protein